MAAPTPLVFNWSAKVPAESDSSAVPTVFGTFVETRLGLRASLGSVALTGPTIDALLEEIWSADVNTSLRAAPGRRHVPASDSRTRSFELVGEEWVTLPAVPVASPGWTLQALPAAGMADDALCAAIVQWADDNALILPPMPGPFAPGNRITVDALRDNFFNAQLRAGSSADVVYFYTAEREPAIGDVAPSTIPGGLVSIPVTATPDWLIPFWHYIDRLRAEAIAHSALYNELETLTADGKMVVDALTVADNAMTLLEAEPPPPSDFFSKIFEKQDPVLWAKVEIKDFHAKLRALRELAFTEYVNNASFPQTKLFNESYERLASIENEDAFAKLYEKFVAARDHYPLTATAYQLATANYIAAHVLHRSSDAYLTNILQVCEEGAAGTTPVSLEVQYVFRASLPTSPDVDSDGVAITSATPEPPSPNDPSPPDDIGDARTAALDVIGNAPGTATLWMALTRISLMKRLAELPLPLLGKSNKFNPDEPKKVFRRYIKNLEKATGVDRDALKVFEREQRDIGKAMGYRGRRLAARMAATNSLMDAHLQAGPAFMAGLGVLDAWTLYAELTGFTDSTGIAKVQHGANAVSAGGSLLGAVCQGVGKLLAPARLTRLGKAARIIDQVLGDGGKFLQFAGYLGHFAAFATAICGAIQLADGIADGDVEKIGLGIGSLLMSAGYWIGVWASKRAPLLFARYATAEVLGITFTEAGLVALGSIIGIIGVVVTIAVLAITHWDEIKAFYYRVYTPGTQQFATAVLTRLKAAHVVHAGPASVRTALDAAIAAIATSTFAVWPHDAKSDTDVGTRKLKAIHMGGDDIDLFSWIPPSATVTLRAGAG